MLQELILFVKDVFYLQLRKTIFDFAQKELAPKAHQIDKDNEFPEFNVSV